MVLSAASVLLLLIETSYLVMNQDGHHVPIDLVGAAALGFVGKQDDLDAQERHEDQRASHGLHVEAGFSLVGHF